MDKMTPDNDKLKEAIEVCEAILEMVRYRGNAYIHKCNGSDQEIENILGQLRHIAAVEAEAAALRKAVEWMKETGDFLAYKAPEQIDVTRLVSAMCATAEDALNKARENRNGEKGR